MIQCQSIFKEDYKEDRLWTQIQRKAQENINSTLEKLWFLSDKAFSKMDLEPYKEEIVEDAGWI